MGIDRYLGVLFRARAFLRGYMAYIVHLGHIDWGLTGWHELYSVQGKRIIPDDAEITFPHPPDCDHLLIQKQRDVSIILI